MPKVQPTPERLYGPLERGFGKRVEMAADHFETKAAAAEIMGISADQLGNIVAERSVPNFAAMAALAKTVKRSLDWLAFGKADDLADLSTRKSFSGGADTVSLMRLDDGLSLPFSRAWLHRMFSREVEDLALLDAPGNAMEPTIKRGALLIIDQMDKRLVDGEIFAIAVENNFIVRRSQLEVGGAVLFRADNESYDTKSWTPDEDAKVNVLGRVVWIGSAA